MKNALFSLLFALALLLPGLIYPATMIVVESDLQTDRVTASTATGFQYSFSGAADYEAGDMISCVMFNSFTSSSIEDDAILAARYAGAPAYYER